MKANRTPTTVAIPVVKPEDKSWERSAPASLKRPISPPPTHLRRRSKPDSVSTSTATKSTSAAVEAGELEVEDHVSFFSSKLLAATRPSVNGQPRLSHEDWLGLYQRNLNDRGHHFVVHQHDHPIAGTHYDLRLQCNATSSVSFAIMYGLPGDPNSRRLNRNATETRVHNLWNHLIETASHETGTMLLWDTGEYTVLPYNSSTNNTNTDDSASDSESNSTKQLESEPAKLHRAFQTRKIKLRLNGARLPKGYTISLRLTHENNRAVQPEAPAYKRRRRNTTTSAARRRREAATSDSSRASSPDVEPSSPSTVGDDLSNKAPARLSRDVSSLYRRTSPPPKRTPNPMQMQEPAAAPPPSGPEPIQPFASSALTATPTAKKVQAEADEETRIRLSNAYPGATNSINSIHQRKWYLSLDRAACGFRPTDRTEFGRRVWVRRATVDDDDDDGGGKETGSGNGTGNGGGWPFHVLGRAVERSILTARTAAEVARDEGLEGYKFRGGWKPVVE